MFRSFMRSWTRNTRQAPLAKSLRGGSLVALPTPFFHNRIDENAFAKMCARQIECGTSALVVCTTTGEASSLSQLEQCRVIEIAADIAGDRVPVIAGAGTCSTAGSIALASQAERAGAAALLCVTPYYMRPTQEGIYRHMCAIHDAVTIPMILYDVPMRTACALADDTIERLARLERIVGLKDATGDLERPARLRPRVGDEFLLLSGDDITQAMHRVAGGDGCISVTANVTPALCADMHHAWGRGDLRTFNRIADLLAPLSRALFVETNPIPVKYALSKMALIADELRMPLTPLSQDCEKTVDMAVESVRSVEQRMHPVIQPPLVGIAPVEHLAWSRW